MHPRKPIATPSFLLFLLAYAPWVTVPVLLFVRPVLDGTGHGLKRGVLFFLLVPVVVVASAWWVGRSTELKTLVARAVGVHAAAASVAMVLSALSQASDPGASGHGGLFWLVFFVPLCAGLAGAAGLVGSLVSAGLMRLLGGGRS